MPLPTTETGLREAGYEPPEKSSKCSSCKAEIEFWRTPKGRLIPLDAGTLVTHFSTCPNADKYRK